MGKAADIDVTEMTKRLAARRRGVEDLLAADDDTGKPTGIDRQSVGRLSRMDAIRARAMAEETARRRETEIRRIDSALSRIVAGDYGWCISCGKAIALKRLESDPATPLCIDCASRAT